MPAGYLCQPAKSGGGHQSVQTQRSVCLSVSEVSRGFGWNMVNGLKETSLDFSGDLGDLRFMFTFHTVQFPPLILIRFRADTLMSVTALVGKPRK